MTKEEALAATIDVFTGFTVGLVLIVLAFLIVAAIFTNND